MPWFKVDDGLSDHPKVDEVGNAAMGLWVRAGSWCSAHPADGFVPARMITKLGSRQREARRLVEVGLWEEAEGGYRFHDWHVYQPTAEEVKQERAAAAERSRRYRARKRETTNGRPTDDHGTTTERPTNDHETTNGWHEPAGDSVSSRRESRYPDPTRPVDEHLQSLPTSTVDKLDDWTREHLI